MSIRIKAETYTAPGIRKYPEEGWLIFGTDKEGRRIRIWVPGARSNAEAVKANVEKGSRRVFAGCEL